jgi:ADP-ribose pyrophosphatase YjhB (NUDIX family)
LRVTARVASGCCPEAIEQGETPEQAAIREMREETGLIVRLTGIVGVFGGPDFVVRYENGDRTSYVMTVFEARARFSTGRVVDQELTETRYASRAEIEALHVARSVLRVGEAVFDLSW